MQHKMQHKKKKAPILGTLTVQEKGLEPIQMQFMQTA
jgi:hypothetical protein